MSKSILMCPPEFFDIEYEINAWMNTQNQVDQAVATQQWLRIREIYETDLGWTVKTLTAQAKVPDLVFTANGGLVIDGKVALPTFRHPVRQPEAIIDKEWFEANGLHNIYTPSNDFEGEGDALVWNDYIFAGYPWRSDKQSHQEIANFFNRRVASLQLVDARFYHLDTALTIVDNETVALWPKAFSEQALQTVHQLVPHVIEASDEDALAYGLNAISDGQNIVLSDQAYHLIDVYTKLGKTVHPTPISEFKKSGGGVKCLSLELRF